MVEAIIFYLYNTAMLKKVYIEITNVCNLNCTFCKKNTREPYMMSLKEFQHILNQLNGVCNYIYLHVQGEPLMHPLLNEFITLANRKGFNIQITTNGTYIHKASYLIDNVRKISFSLHSIKYQNINPMEYIENIMDFCNRCNTTYCDLRFYNQNTMDLKSRQILDYLEDKYQFKITSKNKSYKIAERVFVSFDDLFTWPSLNNAFVSDDGFCYGGLQMLAVLSNGNVSACCLDCDGTINLGNIYIDDIKDILSSNKYQALVNGFKNKKAVEPLCKHCSYRLRFNR